MDDGRGHSPEYLSGTGSVGAHDSPPGGANNISYTNCQVNNFGSVVNSNSGTNYGVISSGSSSPQPATGSQYVSNSEVDQALTPIHDASYTRDRKISPPDSDCFPGTRESVIRGITNWADSPVLFNIGGPHVFWTHGYVGCGKSSISQAVSQKYGRKGRLLGSFFFYRNSGDRSKMVRFAVTLASQMVAAVPATKPFYDAAKKAEPALLTRGGASLATQLERLVYKPFNAAVKRGLIFKTLLQGPFLVVVDGLDECEDKEMVKEFIQHLLDFFKRHPSIPLRFFITSRVESHIKECLNTDGVRLYDLVAHGSDEDILTFLEASFFQRAKADEVIAAYIKDLGRWPTPNDLEELARHIGGSFIFASALFKYIVEPSGDGKTPMDRLPLTLNMNPGLDGLYIYTLARSQDSPHFFDVISTIALLFQPLSTAGIAELLGIHTHQVLHILVNLQAIIHIPGTDELPVTFCHTSLRDFLTTESRSGRFFAPPSHHHHLTYRCVLLRKGQQSRTAAALYSDKHLEEHFEHFIRLPPDAQEPLSGALDALFTQILAQTQNFPNFSDIVSTLALLFMPLPIAEIARLLGIEESDVSQVVDNLRPIVYIPTYVNALVTFRHDSFRDFFTTQIRSGPFFALPSHHLYLSYRCSILRNERAYGSTAASYSVGGSEQHLKQFARLPLSLQGPFPRFPQTLDAFYAHILASAQALPYFLDILSALTLLCEPLPVRGIAELLGLNVDHVYQVIRLLWPIISIPLDQGPVTFHHPSLLTFLTTASRSGGFFVSPSFHLRIAFHCLALKGELPWGSPAHGYLYRVRHLDEHLHFGGLPQPQTLDTFISHTLMQSQHLPYFHDIISTITCLFQPFSIAELAELLGIEISEVSQVLVNLQAIIHTQGIDQPVTMCHQSLCDFLTSEIRSGTCFVSGSDHLRLGYYCFIHNLEYLLNKTATVSSAIARYSERYQRHHIQRALVTGSIPEPSFFTTDLEHFPHLLVPHQTFPYHLFSFVTLFSQIFGHFGFKPPVGVLEALTKSIESLALAVECDTAPGRWLNLSFHQLGFDTFMGKDRYLFRLHKEQATALRENAQRLGTALRVKCPNDPLSSPFDPKNTDFNAYPARVATQLWELPSSTGLFPQALNAWTPMEAYTLFDWIAARLQQEVNLAAAQGLLEFDFELRTDYNQGRHVTLLYKPLGGSPSV